MIDRIPNSAALPPFDPTSRQTAGTCPSGRGTAAGNAPPFSTPGREVLTDTDKQQVRQLKRRDQAVRTHERAHMAAGAGLVQGGVSFTFERGPDGRMYAVGGEVKIDTAAERDPEQTIRKMQQVKRAALAPAEPSGTDRAVAARAGQIESKARQEKSANEQARLRYGNAGGSAPTGRRPADAPLGRKIDITA